MSEQNARRRLINLGEMIALAALVVSALGVWISWKNNDGDKPTRVVEQHSAVPLALRGSTDSDGRTLTIVPADPAHALEGLTVRPRAGRPIDVGSDGRIAASEIETALGRHGKDPKDLTLSIPVRIEARYVERGVDRHGGGNYVLRYKWVGGGLFGGRSIRLLGLSRG